MDSDQPKVDINFDTTVKIEKYRPGLIEEFELEMVKIDPQALAQL